MVPTVALPPATPLTLHASAGVVPEAAFAVKFLVPDKGTVAVAGETIRRAAVGGGLCVLVGEELPPPQLIANATLANTSNVPSRFIRTPLPRFVRCTCCVRGGRD